MGHGPGDKYGYSREVQDETYVASELAKLWKGTVPITATELDERDKRIAELERQVQDLTRLYVEEYVKKRKP